MEAALRRLLDTFDDPEGCEIPGGDWPSFPREDLSASVRQIQEELRSELGLSFDRDANVQDASFHDELRILHPESFRANGVVAILPEIALRFSNFGRLCSIYSAMPDRLTHYPVERITTLLGRHGWTYVPAEALDVVYDGRNPVLQDGKNTWWIRFFDYL